MSKATPRLGKGLSALIRPRTGASLPDGSATSIGDAAGPGRSDPNRLTLIPLERIRRNPNQPRTTLDEAGLQQLADSIRQSGVLQPILVRHAASGQFEIVAGERRWRAAEIAGLEEIPALVRELTEAESFETALIENLQREDLGPLERARGYQQLIDSLGVTPEEVGGRLGESRANIANYLRLLRLTDEVQRMICAGELGMGQARALAGITSPQRQLALASLAARRNLSVRQVEALARQAADTDTRDERPRRSEDAHYCDVERSLCKAIGLRVKLYPGRKKNSGRVVIHYASLDEFDRVAERMGVQPSSE